MLRLREQPGLPQDFAQFLCGYYPHHLSRFGVVPMAPDYEGLVPVIGQAQLQGGSDVVDVPVLLILDGRTSRFTRSAARTRCDTP